MKKKIEKLRAGLNPYGQFIVDEDTGEGKYGDEQIMQLVYKINEIIDLLNKEKNL